MSYCHLAESYFSTFAQNIYKRLPLSSIIKQESTFKMSSNNASEKVVELRKFNYK